MNKQKPNPGSKPSGAPATTPPVAPSQAPKKAPKKKSKLTSHPLLMGAMFDLAEFTKSATKAYNLLLDYLEAKGIEIGQVTNDPSAVVKTTRLLDKNLEKAKKNGKLPEVKNPQDAVTSRIDKLKDDEELIAFMYRSIKVLKPPKTKNLSIRIMYLHLYAHRNVFQHAIYPKSIVEKTKPESGEPTFRVGDPIFFRIPLSSKYNAGFIEDIKGGQMYFTTIKNGKKVVDSTSVQNCFIAFHLPGNKKPILSYKPKKPSDDKKSKTIKT